MFCNNMKIKNYTSLANTKRKKIALSLLEEGLKSASPQQFLKKIIKHNRIILKRKLIDLSEYDNVFLVSFGKAADSMTKVVNSLTSIKGGVLVIPKGSKSLIRNHKFKIFRCGHPTPDKTSVSAAKYILGFLKKLKVNDFVIFLVSGGGSSLLSLPSSITLKDKQKITNLLLKTSPSIQEINCVRKHLSDIKGGKMVSDLGCNAVAIVMSDVSDNDLSSISSGCTYFDKTTFQDAIKIIKKYNLTEKIPNKVLKRLLDGKKGKINETPKTQKIYNEIIATNNECILSMSKKAKKLGFHCSITTISQNVIDEAKKLSKLIPSKKNCCLVFGGETTVDVRGKGKGGRNQELVLRILKELQNRGQNCVVSSVGTDGIDGNTKYAGAIIENFPIQKKIIDSYLLQNNSNAFFNKYGGLIKTGHTHTNLMDIGLIIT